MSIALTMGKDTTVKYKVVVTLMLFVISSALGVAVLNGHNTNSSLHTSVVSSSSTSSKLSFSPSSGSIGYVNSTINMEQNTVTNGNTFGQDPGPTSMAYDSLTGNIYVVDSSSGNVTIINGNTGSVISSFYVGYFISGIVYDSANGYMYVGDQGSDQIAVISGTSVLFYIPVGNGPSALAYDSSNGNVYVTENFGNNVTAIHDYTVVATIGVGNSPDGIAYDSNNADIYVTNEFSDTVSVISSNNVVDTIPVGHYPDGVIYDSVTNTVYVANSGSDTVSLIGQSFPSTNDVFETVNVGVSPENLAVDSYTGAVFVSNYLSNNVNVITGTYISGITVSAPISTTLYPQGILFNPSNDNIYVSGADVISVINGQTLSSLTPIIMGYFPSKAAYDSSNGYLYVTDYNLNNVSIINTKTGKILKNIPVGQLPNAIYYDSSNGNVYVGDTMSSDITVISTGSNSVINTYSLAASSSNENGFAFDSNTNILYYVQSATDKIWELNTVTGSTPSAITTPSNFAQIAYDPSNEYLYATDFSSPDLTVINTVTGNVVQTVSLNAISDGVYYDSSNNDVYVANQQSAKVSVVSGSTAQVIKTINVGYYPSQITMDSNSGYLYVTDLYSNNVSVINQSTNSLVGSINVASEPYGIAYDSADNSLYVVNENSGSLSVILQKPVTLYNMVFTESGLTSGTKWSVTINGHTTNSTSNQIVLSVPNGTYVYKVDPVSGYYQSSSQSGTIYVNGNGFTDNVKYDAFATVVVNVSPSTANVSENGLNLTLSKGKTTLSLLPGTYFFNASLGGYSSYSNSIYVSSGKTYTLTITLKVETGSGYLEGTITPRDGFVTANGISIPTYNGYFNETLPVGTYYVTASAAGYVGHTYVVQISKGKETPVIISLSNRSKTVILSGNVTPGAPSVVLNGFSAYVNQTGHYSISLPTGKYTLSAFENGYFPYSKKVDLTTSTSINITMQSLPPYTSQSVKGGSTATGYNVHVSHLVNSKGTINVNFTSSNNGEVLIEVPFSELSNTNITDVLNSKIFIDGSAYSNFSITVTSNHTVILDVYGLKAGDPALYWAYSPSSTVPSYYTLSFSESGLPSGTSWSVTVNGNKYSSTGSDISVKVLNGTYSYKISPISNYTLTTSVGNATVQGSNNTVQVPFNSVSNGTTRLGGYDPLIIVVAIIAVGVIAGFVIGRKRRN